MKQVHVTNVTVELDDASHKRIVGHSPDSVVQCHPASIAVKNAGPDAAVLYWSNRDDVSMVSRMSALDLASGESVEFDFSIFVCHGFTVTDTLCGYSAGDSTLKVGVTWV